MKAEQNFIRGFFFILFIAFVLAMTGCSTVNNNEHKAKLASEWVKERSGFIRDAVAAIVRVSVYATEKDSIERILLLERINSVSRNLTALIDGGITDADSIQKALKINEENFAPIFNAVSALLQVEMKHFRENGYSDLAISVLSAVSKGIADGSVTQ